MPLDPVDLVGQGHVQKGVELLAEIGAVFELGLQFEAESGVVLAVRVGPRDGLDVQDVVGDEVAEAARLREAERLLRRLVERFVELREEVGQRLVGVLHR